MNIGERIKRARQEAGITQSELAKRLNVTPQTVSQYERGLINPKYETALKFAEALNLQPSWLFGAKLGELAAEDTINLVNKEQSSRGVISELLDLPQSIETVIKSQQELDVQRAFRKLNDEGQRVAIERVEELAQIPKYQKTAAPAGDDSEDTPPTEKE